MKQYKLNNDGFAHPVFLVIILVAIVGLIGYSGQRVWSKQKQAALVKNAVGTLSNDVAGSPGSITLSSPEAVTVGGSNSAAAQAPKTSAPSAQALVNASYDVKTPLGSLNQLISELKSLNFSNALFFITPRFMFQTSSLVQTTEPVTLERCKSNDVCKMLLNANIGVIDTNLISDYESTTTTAEGKSLKFNMTWKDGTLISQHPRYGGEYQVQVDMLNIGSNWVVDRLTVNGYTI